MIPTCFSQSNTKLQSSNVHNLQSLITCIYKTKLCNSPTLLTLTWSKSLSSHSLSLSSPSFSTSLSLSPSPFSLFKPTSKSLSLTHNLKLHFDFSHAKFSPNSALPNSSFYLAIFSNKTLEFFLGDLFQELAHKTRFPITNPLKPQTALARRDHVFAHRSYVSQAEFLGSKREIEVEVCNGGVLKVSVDGETKLTVKRLGWKFRGNERFFVGGVAVEFFWDVLNWVKNNNGGSKHGVFGFKVGELGGVWPEIVGVEKKLMKKWESWGVGSVMQWAEESSDGGRSSSSSSSSRSSGCNNGGFSLLLYAWRKD